MLMRFPILVLAFISSFAFADVRPTENPTGLKTGLAVDINGNFGKAARLTDRDQIFIREAELTFLAPIDPLFDGVLTGSAHREAESGDANGDGVIDPGEYTAHTNFELHEAYLSSSKLIPRSRIKAGRYQVGLGRLNRIHRHDWEFTSAPLINEQVFGEEAYFDNGLEYSWLMPLPFYLDWTVGLTDGANYGKSEGNFYKARSKFAYSRLATYFSIGDTGGAEIGANYAQTKNDSKYQIAGADFTAKWRDGKVVRFLFQGEYWNKSQRQGSPITFDQRTSGFYLFPQVGFDENISFGVRYDFLHVKNSRLGFKHSVNAVMPVLSIKPSEFSRFNLSYSRQSRAFDAVNLTSNNKPQSQVELQATFILGTHPAHNF
ncbi:MAG: hypothetical protein H7301_13640 [Cryobacterium sp.]|nr:hypothetical protein [Oligoflexia bacterium]